MIETLSSSSLLRGGILPFLSINDTTNLGLTSRDILQLIQGARHHADPHCSIVREQRLPTKIGRERRSSAVSISVWQIQKFVFTIHTNTTRNVKETLSIQFDLKNLVWKEHNNSRIPNLDTVPSKTVASIALIRPNLPLSSQTRYRMFIFRPNFYQGHPSWTAFLGEKHGSNYNYLSEEEEGEFTFDESAWTEPDKDEVRRAMYYIWLCAERISLSSPSIGFYPSSEYLMGSLPKWLHKYYPIEFLQKSSPGWKQSPDRQLIMEFEYLPARSMQEWMRTAPIHDDGIYEYGLAELPWYAGSYYSGSEDDWYSGSDYIGDEDDNEEISSSGLEDSEDEVEDYNDDEDPTS